MALGHHFLHMEPSLTAIAAGLLIGLVYCLVNVRVREPGVFALIGLAVMLLGPVTAYLYPFGVGLLLGLAYDTFEEEWYGSAIADSARASYRVRLFLKNSVAGWVSRYRSGGGFGFRERLKPGQVVDRAESRSESATPLTPL
jgi:xanthosine utilization system XapX-like protein